MSPDDAEAQVAAIAARHGLDAAPRQRFAAGSVPVYAVGDAHVVKLFPPGQEVYWRTEQDALRAVEGRLPVPTPRLDAAETHCDGHYLLMARLPGQPLDEVWAEVPASDRAALMDEVGALLRALHQIPVAGLETLTPDWPAFVAAQRAGCAARQAQRGLTSPWVEQIEPFLAEVDLPPPRSPALLHTEVMQAHLHVARGPEGWRLSGLLDFEPAMVGDAEYELASVAVFVAEGDPALFARVLEVRYGALDPEAGRALRRRVMAWLLLHRYSRLSWYLERLAPPPEVGTLEALMQRWLG